jgi:hypothetical protein
MAKSVFMSTEGVEVYREESAPVFEVREGSGLVGRLTVSKGGVRWSPTGARGDGYHLGWEAFDEIMKKQKRG